MKLISIHSAFVVLNMFQSVMAETIKIVQSGDTGSWSYRVKTLKNADTTIPSYTQIKHFKKDASISFNASNDSVIVQVYKGATGAGEPRDIALVENGKKNYQDNNIYIEVTKTGYLVKFLPKDAASFAKTHKVSVENVSDDKDTPLEVAAITTDEQKPDGVFYQYGKVSFKKKTNPGQGLTIPQDRDFILLLQGEGVDKNITKTRLTKEQAPQIKKIKTDKRSLYFDIM